MTIPGHYNICLAQILLNDVATISKSVINERNNLKFVINTKIRKANEVLPKTAQVCMPHVSLTNVESTC